MEKERWLPEQEKVCALCIIVLKYRGPELLYNDIWLNKE